MTKTRQYRFMKVEIVEYQPAYADDFKNLNVEWLQKYFEIEPHDTEQLEHPEKIVEEGGHIYFARQNGVHVGTATLIKESSSQFELAKMAVTEKAKGQGIGNLLMEHCIREAEKLGADKVILLSNRSLKPAIALYQKYGFREVAVPADNPYCRCNIKMELNLAAQLPAKNQQLTTSN